MRGAPVRVATTVRRRWGIKVARFMRRLLTIYGLVCALALGASWSRLLTADVCAYAAAANATQDDACCPAHVKQHNHHNAAALHTPALAPATSCCDGQLAASAQVAFQLAAACAHCLSRSMPAPLLTGMRAAQPTTRAASGPALLVRQLAAPEPVRASVIMPPQHAPPAGECRHLLLSTFLI